MYNYNCFSNGNWLNEIRNDSISNQNLVTPSVGFDRGNMFNDLYDQYKNYRPKQLVGRDERENLLLSISRLCFAAHELNLYLDIYPNDISMLTLFNDYQRKADELTRTYEAKYGPLSIDSDNLNQTPFMWEESVWPWEGKFNV